MKPMKTPGVYIVEKSAFPNSVVQVATAVPAFIGYTEKALNENKSLSMKPWRITSMAEFTRYYGDAPDPKFQLEERPEEPAEEESELSAAGIMKSDTLPEAKVTVKKGAKDVIYDIKLTTKPYCLYAAMKHFYLNGGGPCYVVSVGNYDEDIEAGKMLDGIKTLIKEQEPTMVVIPETTRLARGDGVNVQQQMLMHCGDKMRNRVAILDIFAGHLERQDSKGDPVATFRNDIGINHLNYGAAYYPWVNSSIFTSRDFTYENLDDETREKLIPLLKKSANPGNLLPEAQLQLTNSEIVQIKKGTPPPEGQKQAPYNEEVTIEVGDDDTEIDPETVQLADATSDDGRTKEVENVGIWKVSKVSGAVTFKPAVSLTKGLDVSVAYTAKDAAGEDKNGDITLALHAPRPSVRTIDGTLRTIAPLYTEIMDEITKFMNTVPPAAAMAGIYTMVDNNRGVWKAPANVSLNSVTSPTVNISHDDQEDLNVTPQGKSINAIRPFVGEGTLVWGARTLDGNSLDWRYISVRRTMIMLEESIRLASKAYVFEPNVANTWVTIRSMIENFLTGVWKQGGLAGAVPADAFSVHCGLGDTMTPVDILEGILRVTVLVAVSRPAEFIEITFQQQMQKS